MMGEVIFQLKCLHAVATTDVTAKMEYDFSWKVIKIAIYANISPYLNVISLMIVFSKENGFHFITRITSFPNKLIHELIGKLIRLKFAYHVVNKRQ